MKIFGAKFNMFCSPQPYGIFNRLSIFDKLGPIKSPVKIKHWIHHSKMMESFDGKVLRNMLCEQIDNLGSFGRVILLPDSFPATLAH